MSADATVTGTQPAAAEAAASIDLAEISRRLFEEAFNEGRLELADQYVSPDAIDHDPAQPARMRGTHGPAVLKQTVQMYRTAFPDVRVSVDDLIVSDDKVVMRWHSDGTHRGELEGMAPTGARVSVTGISIDRWQDGKIVESWSEWDNLGLARQLGAAPPEDSIGEKIGMQLQRLAARRMRKQNDG